MRRAYKSDNNIAEGAGLDPDKQHLLRQLKAGEKVLMRVQQERNKLQDANTVTPNMRYYPKKDSKVPSRIEPHIETLLQGGYHYINITYIDGDTYIRHTMPLEYNITIHKSIIRLRMNHKQKLKRHPPY